MRRWIPRQFERTRYLADVSVHPLPGDAAFAAYTLDLSKAGLALFIDRFLAVGQPVELVLEAGAAARCAFLGRVVHVRVEPEGNVLGIAFARPLSTEEFRVLKAQLRPRAGRSERNRETEGKG